MKNIGKGVRLLALVCPRNLVKKKMIVLGRACPSYIVKRFFLKTLPFCSSLLQRTYERFFMTVERRS